MPATRPEPRRRPPSLESLQRRCDAWNARYSIGTNVIVRKDGGAHVNTKTRSTAEVLSGHSAVIWLEDISGCYLLDRVTPVLQLDGAAGRAPDLLFDEFQLDEANDEWQASCGPAALAAILGLSLPRVRELMPDFRGWTNAVMMTAALDRNRSRWQRITQDGTWPVYGLARIQWGGPWMQPGVPERARLTQTHWVAVAPMADNCGERAIFDVNAMLAGGWITEKSWSDTLVPELTREIDRADGTLSITYGVEVRHSP